MTAGGAGPGGNSRAVGGGTNARCMGLGGAKNGGGEAGRGAGSTNGGGGGETGRGTDSTNDGGGVESGVGGAGSLGAGFLLVPALGLERSLHLVVLAHALIGGIALAILMIGFAVYRADPRNNFYYYIGAVAIVYVLTLIILVADAASEGGAAIAAAIFPPYAFYYVFVVCDNGLLKFLYIITSIAAGLLRFALRYG